MTLTATPARPTHRDPTRRYTVAAGALYLLTFVASIPAVLLLDPVLTDRRYVVGPGSDGRVLLGCLLDVVTAVACLGTAVAVFPAVRRRSEGLALSFVASRTIEAAVILTGVVCLLGVVTLRRDPAGTDDATLVGVGQALVAVRDRTFQVGPGLMPVFNALFFGTLLFRARLVPRGIPLLGLIGAPLLLTSTTATVLGLNDPFSIWSGLAAAPIALWELLIGGWMLFRGFRSDLA